MKNHNAFKDNGVKKYYILTRPTKLSDMSFDEIDDETGGWREKSKQLQASAGVKIRHHLA